MANQPDPAARREMFIALQTIVAGQDALVGVAAVADTLGAIVAFICKDQDEAKAFLTTLIDDVSRDVVDNWQTSREARAQAVVAARIQ